MSTPWHSPSSPLEAALSIPIERRSALRVALLTMLEAGDGGLPRAFLRVGGMTIAQQQLALALALKCERIACLAESKSPELVDLQHEAEAAGVQFHVIAGPRALLGLVIATDEVFVLSDGLFASVPEAAALLEQGQSVLVQPIEQGLEAGFERIDLNHASAGAMRLPGRLVDLIAELPADCDAASALQRIALQSGVRQRSIPPIGNGRLFWTLVHSEAEAHALEPHWVRQQTRDASPLGPSRAVALVAVRNFGPAMLHAGSGARHLASGAGLSALIALGAGWFGLISLGFGFAAVGWMLRETADLLSRLEGRVPVSNSGWSGMALYGWALDLIIIGLAGWGAEVELWQHFLDRFFPPFMLVALMRILPGRLGEGWGGWLGDRALLSLLMAFVIGFGVGHDAIRIAAVCAALAGIVLPGLQRRLTRA